MTNGQGGRVSEVEEGYKNLLSCTDTDCAPPALPSITFSVLAVLSLAHLHEISLTPLENKIMLRIQCQVQKTQRITFSKPHVPGVGWRRDLARYPLAQALQSALLADLV